MAKFLDENGVRKLWSRIQEYVYECCCSKGGGGDVGYECQGGYETLWQGSVTTEDDDGYYYASIPYTKQITTDKLRVTFDGVVYECNKEVDAEGGGNVYGGSGTDDGHDFGYYPFSIFSGFDPSGSIYNEIATKANGTYTLKIEADNTVVTATECFQKAVKSVGDSGYECKASWKVEFYEDGATEQEEGSDPSALLFGKYVDASEIKVVFNGKEYICPGMAIPDGYVYGSSHIATADYPFGLEFKKDGASYLYTEEPMNFNIEVAIPVTTATVTPCFEAAVKTVTSGLTVINAYSYQNGDCTIYTLDKTGEEILEILQSGGNIAINISPQESSMDLYFPYSMMGTELTPIKNATLTAQNKTATSPLKAKPMALIIEIISPYTEEKIVKWQFSTEYLDDYPSYTYCTGK